MQDQSHSQKDDDFSSDLLSENVSALMDGEAGDLELRRILKQIEEESADLPDSANDFAGVKATWRRYHLVRDVLNHEIHSNPATNLLPGIRARLAEEQVDHSKAMFGRSLGGIVKRLGQTAVAASVAFTVLYTGSYVQTAMLENGQDSETIASNSSNLPALGGDYTPSRLTRTVSMDAAAKERIQRAVYQYSGTQPYSFPAEEEQNPVELSEDIQDLNGQR